MIRALHWYSSGFGVLTEEFLMNFHLLHFKHKGYYYNKMYTTLDKISYYVTIAMMGMMVFGMILFNLSPMYNNFKSGAFTGHIKENATLDYSVYYSFPGYKPMEQFYFITIVNVYFSYICSTTICGYDLYITLVIVQVIGHYKILQNYLSYLSFKNENLSTDYTSQSAIFNDDENKYIYNKLVDCIEHHKIIIKFTDEIIIFFGPILAITYLFHLVACCLLLLECSQLNLIALARFGPLTIIIFSQLVQLSILFEVVSAESEKVINHVYAMAWERMNIKNQRIVCFMLKRVQSTVNVTALGIVPVGVQTMAGILKTTFSYFTFLRTMD